MAEDKPKPREEKTEFKAVRDKDGNITIFPQVEKKTNEGGGTDVTVHMPALGKIYKIKEVIKDGEWRVQ